VLLLTSALILAAALVGVFAYAHANNAGRCSYCRAFSAGAPLRHCVCGHKLHHACIKYAMNREVCPICGIYVSEFTGSANPI